MSDKTLTIARLISGGLIINYHCTSACRHCLYRCSPRWPREYISPDVTWKNLLMIRDLGCSKIHIGGGEPLLNPDCVVSVLDLAHEAEVDIDYVETNSSWYRGHDEACVLLDRLSAKGLSTLLVSISPFHNEHIPFYKVKGVIAACHEVGIAVFPWIAAFVSDICTFDVMTPHSLEEYQRHFGEEYVEQLPRRYWISPGGRALETFGRFTEAKTLNAIIDASAGGCKELAQVSHFHVDLFGNYIPGLCAGLSIRTNDLGKPLDPEKYPIITGLYAGGIGTLTAYAAREYGFTPKKRGYSSKCELCYEIRRALVVEKGSNSEEIPPHGHYRYG